ncbi:MAG: response regulator transcription factor [Chloroflexi bacterium]|nr:response regulator transcription factor [Chloroflexota bacterium]MCI0575523.1 response regulator transcription factor [Chloroflexota bacterium]MCI0644300.1 response regulator transcription factor [Chloroflexota bacterium]MCI0726283.1 response regulator transcription factor [Chloroflexota bacterium]
MKNVKVLVIDDDTHLCALLKTTFSRAGAHVYVAYGGATGLQMLYAHRPDLVILDIMMPGTNGWDMCRQIRQLSDVPIIMLTALQDDSEIVRGLEAGADDYVTKPFSGDVLLARARAVLRRHGSAVSADTADGGVVYDDGHLSIDMDGRRVAVGGQPVKLSATELGVLIYLLQNAGRVCTFEQILTNVWGDEYRDSADHVHVYVWHLRQKLEKNPKQPQYILTEPIGYSFQKRPAD